MGFSKLKFELTNVCNFKCRHCFHDIKTTYIATDMAFLSLDKMKKAGFSHLVLTGGEPSIHPDFDKIYKLSIEIGYTVEIFTNGSRLSDFFDLFLEWPPSSIDITLYGFDRDSYEHFSSAGNQYEKVFLGIKQLKDNKIPFTLRAPVTKININDVLNGKMDFWEELFCKKILYFYHIYNSLEGNNINNNLSLSAYQCIELLKTKMPDRFEKKKLRFYNSECEWFDCNAGLTEAYIQSNGNLALCTMDNQSDINVLEANALEKLNGRRNVFNAKKTDIPCATCRENQGCISCPIEFQTSYDKKICQYQKELKELTLA